LVCNYLVERHCQIVERSMPIPTSPPIHSVGLVLPLLTPLTDVVMDDAVTPLDELFELLLSPPVALIARSYGVPELKAEPVEVRTQVGGPSSATVELPPASQRRLDDQPEARVRSPKRHDSRHLAMERTTEALKSRGKQGDVRVIELLRQATTSWRSAADRLVGNG
jgi:hypothetical protein